jgi:hypothetical protein
VTFILLLHTTPFELSQPSLNTASPFYILLCILVQPTSAKDKEKEKSQPITIQQPQPDDAYLVIECALAIGGGAQARRDDDRDLELAAAIKSWDMREPGRNNRGAEIR